MVITPSGVVFQITPEGRSWLGIASIHKDFFDSLETDAEVAKALRINASDFSDFIKTARSDDKFHLFLDEIDNSLKLNLKSKNMNKNVTLRLIDIPEDFKIFKALDLEFDTEATVKFDIFNDALKVVNLGDVDIKLKHTPHSLSMQAETEDKSRKAEVMIEYDDENVQNVIFKEIGHKNLPVPKELISSYKYSFILKSIKTIKNVEAITFGMINQGPIRIKYNIGDYIQVAYAITPLREIQ